MKPVDVHRQLHDVARSRGNLASAMARVTAATLVIGISSDLLYPNYQQRQIDEILRSEGVWSRYTEIDSPHGHDAFLINVDQLGDCQRRHSPECRAGGASTWLCPPVTSIEETAREHSNSLEPPRPRAGPRC